MFSTAIDISKRSEIKTEVEKVDYFGLEVEATVFVYNQHNYSIADKSKRWVEEKREFYASSDAVVDAVDGLTKLRLLNAFKRVVESKAKSIGSLDKPQLCYGIFDDVITVENRTYYNLYLNKGFGYPSSSPVYRALYQLRLKRPYVAGLRDIKLKDYSNNIRKPTKVWR